VTDVHQSFEQELASVEVDVSGLGWCDACRRVEDFILSKLPADVEAFVRLGGQTVLLLRMSGSMHDPDTFVLLVEGEVHELGALKGLKNQGNRLLHAAWRAGWEVRYDTSARNKVALEAVGGRSLPRRDRFGRHVRRPGGARR
jgi:hypothetical protein